VVTVSTEEYGDYARTVDLSGGRDQTVVLDPQLITIRGRLLVGDQPRAGAVAASTTTGEVREGIAIEDGSFELVTISPVRALSAKLKGRGAFVDLLNPLVTSSVEHDILIPDNKVSVRVVDADSGDPIAKASVVVRNQYVPAADSDTPRPDPKSAMAVSDQVIADARGVAILPPQRPGTLSLRATADGYRPSVEEVLVQLSAEDREREATITLRKQEPSARLTIFLQDGRAAAGARILLSSRADALAPIFEGRATSEGAVDVPLQSGVLLVTHPDGGFAIQRWSVDESGDERRVVLPSPGGLLNTVVVDSRQEPVPWASVVVFVDDLRIQGSLLAWLTEAPPASDATGRWVGRNLPSQALRLLAWTRANDRQGLSGALDGRATSVPYPWPAALSVTAVD
jgi:hypothetical protein